MRNRSFLALSFPLLLLGGCARSTAHSLEHWVFFTLEEPSEQGELARDCEPLRELEGVLGLEVGRPLAGDRPEVDREFHVALRVSFQDAEAYRAYLVHPVHERLVKTWGPRFERVRIFDVAPFE